MQLSQFPQPIETPFAAGAGANYIRPIPIASQIGTNPGAASYTDGFVPLNFQPISGGGIPPDGRDMNGILYAITALLQWYNSGGAVAWSQTTATGIGGYPKYAIVQSQQVYPGVIWVSLVDNNAVNPDTGTPTAPATGWTTLIEWMILAATGTGTSFATQGYLNGWIDAGTIGANTFAPCYFYKDLMGFIHIQGTCKNGTVPSPVIQLPSGQGLWPGPQGLFGFMGVSNNSTGVWLVTATGQVQVTNGSSSSFSFGGNTYYGNPTT
jgi:hypothetical protein